MDLIEKIQSGEDAKSVADKLYTNSLVPHSILAGKNGLTLSGYVSKSNGNFVSDNNYMATDFIPVWPRATVIGEGRRNSGLQAGCCCYDQDKKFIKVILNDMYNSANEKATEILHENAAFVRLSFHNSETTASPIRIYYQNYQISASLLTNHSESLKKHFSNTIVNDLNTGGTDKLLSAEQGKVLDSKIKNIDLSDYAKKADIKNEIGDRTDQAVSQNLFTDTLYAESSSKGYVDQTITTSSGFFTSGSGVLNSTSSAYKNVKLEIPVKTSIRISGSVMDKGTALIIYLDANNKYISEECRGTSSMTTYTNHECTIPPTAKYVCITVYSTSSISVKFAVIDGVGFRFSPKSDIEGLTEKMSQLEKYEVSTDYWKDNLVFVGFIGKNGLVASTGDASWRFSDFMPFYPHEPLDIRCQGHILINTVSFYDENKQYISGFGVDKESTFEKVVTSPADTRYIRLSGGADTSGGAQASKPFRALSTISLLNQIRAFSGQSGGTSETSLLTVNRKQVKLKFDSNSKIILYGDSIFSTDYTWMKDAMESLTGATVYNGGFSANTTASLASNIRLKRIFDYNPNLIIALVGGNDAGTVVGTFGAISGEPIVAETDISVDYNGTYFIQAVSHIIRKIKDQYYDIRKRANLTGSETVAEKEAKIDAVLKPYFVFCTTLPQKRGNTNSSESNPENWERKRKAVIECCNKYNVHCIDLCDLLGWDMSKEPSWPGITNFTDNRGIYTMDGLHPNKYGYQQIASIICGELGII